MQDRYAGDVGDFSKFLLLKSLLEGHDHKLGVVWYRRPNEIHNNDGGHVEYLQDPRFKDCDPDLLSKLSRVVHSTRRSIKLLQASAILPENTTYYPNIIDFDVKYGSQSQRDKTARQRARLEWCAEANKALLNSNVLFLDPDNGLEVASCSEYGRMRSGKYAYYEEVSRFLRDRDICVVYQHMNHTCSHIDQISSRIAELRRKVDPLGRILALQCMLYSSRAYFILTSSQQHQNSVKIAIDALMSSACGSMWYLHAEGDPSYITAGTNSPSDGLFEINHDRVDTYKGFGIGPEYKKPCLCGCNKGLTGKGSFYLPGHDAILRANVRKVNDGKIDVSRLSYAMGCGAIVQHRNCYQVLTVAKLRSAWRPFSRSSVEKGTTRPINGTTEIKE